MAKPQTATDTTELTISPDALAAMAKAMSEATQAATRRENPNPPPLTACGFPASAVPALVYKEVYFCGAPQKQEWLTPDEATLFNQIAVPGTYGPDKTWEVRIDKDRSTLHVLIHGVNRRETRLELPRSLKDILRIIVDEQSAVAA
jgi:hypothetical protein